MITTQKLQLSCCSYKTSGRNENESNYINLQWKPLAPYLPKKSTESLLPPTVPAPSSSSAASATFRLDIASPLYEIIESTACRADFKATSWLQCCRTADNVHYSFEVAIFVIDIHFTRFRNTGLRILQTFKYRGIIFSFSPSGLMNNIKESQIRDHRIIFREQYNHTSVLVSQFVLPSSNAFN